MRALAAVLAVVIVFAAYYAGGMFSPRTVVVYTEGAITYAPYFENATAAAVTVPAVDDAGNGVATQLIVQLLPGTGRILVNIDKMVFWTDTQDSIRAARDVAAAFTGENASAYDFFYTIKADASVIEGPSAGAALAVATAAALEGKNPNASVMITGTISSDGRIGQIGEAGAKAKAAGDIGAQLFVVPKGQIDEVRLGEECRSFGAARICSMGGPGRQANLTIAEAGTLAEAMVYFAG